MPVSMSILRMEREGVFLPQKWVKHTINLVYGSDLDMKFKISPNKSHMVRHVFRRAEELRMEVLNLLEENQQMKENIAKLQARLSGANLPLERTDLEALSEYVLPDIEAGRQMTFDVESPNEKWIREQKELNE